MKLDRIVVYCDGGCRGNGKKNNIGGWGAYLVYKENKKYLRGATRHTTNNIMELTSCIKALQALKRKDIPVEVVMDSAYVVNGISSWIYGWMKRGWVTSKNEAVENQELWKELYQLKCEFKSIKFIKVKGHADNAGNNKADALANEAMDELIYNES